MRLCLLARNPTDSVTEGFLPAAARLGLHVTLLTDQPDAHRADASGTRDLTVVGCDVHDVREVIAELGRRPRPDAVFSNSDHLQAQTALAADYLGLPGKDWRAALRAKNKAELRRHLAAAGADTVRSAELPPELPLDAWLATPAVLDQPYPCVLKPREGVASEDVVLVADAGELAQRCKEIRARRPGAALVAEEYLPGELFTLETLGDATRTHVLGGFCTELSAPPYFVEERMAYVPEPDPAVVAGVLAQLAALGVGFGACHTEFVVGDDGRARLIEVNYRAIGDRCDLLLADLLGIPLFEHILRVHLGEPLPPRLDARRDRRARLEYPCADRAGTLTAAPGPCERVTPDGVRLTYRPLRAIGERRPLHHSNRDILGLIRATGTDQRAVDRAVADFRAAQRWEITP